MDTNPVKNIKNLLIICAMDVEEKAILDANNHKFKEIVVDDQLGIKYKKLEVTNGHTLLITQSGIGSINSAVNIAFINKNHPIDAVILLGVAGSLREELNIGDIIVASEIIKHDSIYSGPDKKELMAPGELYLSLKPENRISPHLNTDFLISNWLFDELKKISYNSASTYYGTLMSGDEFVGNKNRKLDIAHLSKTSYAVEMEASGIALICKKLAIPFIAIKTIVDRLNPLDGISNDYSLFLKKASKNTEIVFDLIMKSWGSTHEVNSSDANKCNITI